MPAPTAQTCDSSNQKASAERVFALRAGLRRVTESERERRCGVSVCYEQGPALLATGRSGTWACKWTGIVTCGHIWTCPVCSRAIRTRRLTRVMHALEMSLGRWQMVNLTIRHSRAMPLRWLLSGMMRAWRRARQGGATQAIWTERVTASVRATEVTYGANGFHPHLHVLLRTSEWTEEETDALRERWQAAVLRELGPECVPSDERAVVWSTPIDLCRETLADAEKRAGYLFKLGLEIAGAGKVGRGRSLSAWELLDAAISGAPGAATLWREYAAATRGKRMIELDDRAQRFAKMPSRGALEEPLRESTVERLTIHVDALELRALREYERLVDPRIMGIILSDASTAEDPRKVVETWVGLVTATLRGYTQRNGQGSDRREESRHPRGAPRYLDTG